MTSRREFLANTGRLAAAGFVAPGVLPSVIGDDSDADGAAKPVAVIDQLGASLELEGVERPIPMEGFPEGWRMEPGERVCLVSRAGQATVAMPLVEWVDAPESEETVRRTGRVDVAGEPLVLTDATVWIEDDAHGDRHSGDGSGEILVCVVDHGRSLLERRVIAAHPH